MSDSSLKYKNYYYSKTNKNSSDIRSSRVVVIFNKTLPLLF